MISKDAILEGSLDKIISDEGDSSHELEHRICKANVTLITEARIIKSKGWHIKNSENKNENMISDEFFYEQL